METNNSRTAFQKALICSVLKDYDTMLAQIPSIQPSEKLQNWMQSDVQAKKKHIITRRVAKGLLIAVLIIVLLAVSAMAVPAIRDAFINFFLKGHDEDHYSITFDPEQAATAPHEIESVYHISHIPEGFVLAVENSSISLYTSIWISDDGAYMQYTQRVLPNNPTEDNWIGIDYVEDPTVITIEGYAVQIIPGKENDMWIWTNNAYVFTLEIPDSLSKDEAIKIFESWNILQ